MSGTYINDLESPGELARLIKQADLLQTCTGIFPRLLQGRTFQNVLDIGCGPGNWVLAVAAASPETNVFGMDISERMITYASSRAQVLSHLDRVVFEGRNALDERDFPAEQERYDYINLSLANSWVPDRATWKTLLQRCYAALDPGGVVVITETEVALTSSPALQTFQALLLNAFKASGRSTAHGEHFGVVEHLGMSLREAGFQKVSIEVNAFDFSYYNEQENRAQRDLIPILFNETKTFLLKHRVTTEERLVNLEYGCLVQLFQESFTAIAPLYTVLGEKA